MNSASSSESVASRSRSPSRISTSRASAATSVGSTSAAALPTRAIAAGDSRSSSRVKSEPPILSQRFVPADAVAAVRRGPGHDRDPVGKIGGQRDDVVGHLREPP